MEIVGRFLLMVGALFSPIRDEENCEELEVIDEFLYEVIFFSFRILILLPSCDRVATIKLQKP